MKIDKTRQVQCGRIVGSRGKHRLDRIARMSGIAAGIRDQRVCIERSEQLWPRFFHCVDLRDGLVDLARCDEQGHQGESGRRSARVRLDDSFKRFHGFFALALIDQQLRLDD